MLLHVGKTRQVGVAQIVVVNKSINGIVYSHTTQMIIAKAFSWTGFYFHRVVFAVVIQIDSIQSLRLNC